MRPVLVVVNLADAPRLATSISGMRVSFRGSRQNFTNLIPSAGAEALELARGRGDRVVLSTLPPRQAFIVELPPSP
jgi:hypothetical protein